MNPLTERQRRAWEKIGNVLVPGGKGLPSFSESGVSRYLEDVLEQSPEEDRRSLLLLVTVLGWWPRILLRLMLMINDTLRRLPGPAGGPFRLLDMGLRGVVFTLYYSGLDPDGRVHNAIDCHIQCQPLPEEPH